LLFEGTLLENITMGRKAANIDNVKWAVEKTGLNDFVRTLPKGFDSPIDPEGKNLSSSTIQKILLARSIADRPCLLLLEDALVHIETKQRQKIIDFLTGPEAPWTLIAVSSDLRFAKNCQQVVVLDKGKILQSGTFETIKSSIEDL